MPEHILALDVGTTSVRAAVVAPNGVLAGLNAAPIRSVAPGPGRVEQDAEAVWRATRKVIASALSGAGRTAHDLAGLGFTSQRASAVVWDRRTGRALTPMVVWSDLSGVAAAGALAQSGFMVAPQQSATKLPALIARAQAPAAALAWGNIDSFILYRLSGGGAHVADRSQAWPSGYLSLMDLNWNPALISHQNLPQTAFPTLVDSWGRLGATAAKVLGAEISIGCDIADQAAAVLAHGEAEGTAKFTFGTAGAYDVVTGPRLVFSPPAAAPLLGSVAGGQICWTAEGMINSAGSALDWLRGACGLGGHERFAGLAARAHSSGGAAFLPALQGLGAPHGDAARRGLLAGLNPASGQAEIALAGLEGVAFRAREIIQAVDAASGVDDDRTLRVDGGLTRSRMFLQVLADATGRAVLRHATPEATLLGAAMAAARGCGVWSESDLSALRRYAPAVEPRISADEGAARFAAWRTSVG